VPSLNDRGPMFYQPPGQGVGSLSGFQPEDNISSILSAGTRKAGCGKPGWEAPCSPQLAIAGCCLVPSADGLACIDHLRDR